MKFSEKRIRWFYPKEHRKNFAHNFTPNVFQCLYVFSETFPGSTKNFVLMSKATELLTTLSLFFEK